MDRWGDTLNTMGKYAGLKLSYRAMVKKAQDDAERGEKELQSYLSWVSTCSAKQSAKGADFAKYLKASTVAQLLCMVISSQAPMSRANLCEMTFSHVKAVN